MRPLIPEYLDSVLRNCEADRSGELADYIPELAQADPERFGMALTTVDGSVYRAGDSDDEFTIQSVSKPFVYALALQDLGLDAVLDKVDVEPSGDAFNHLSLEKETGRPLNPMINAGALATHALIERGGDVATRVDRILAGLSAFAGRELSVDERVFDSELQTAYRNRALANMLRSLGNFELDPLEVVYGYTRQCAVLVTATDLSMMAATLANGGVQPVTGERVISRRVVRQVLSVMTTCGMYDSAGDWLSTVGIPAKSGVSGGLLGVLPGQSGIATFSPRLDKHGTSVRGVQAFQRCSDELGLHLMEVVPAARGIVREFREVAGAGEPADVLALHGTIQFAGAERLVRTLVEEEPTASHLVFDLTEVHAVNTVAGSMLRRSVRLLIGDGHHVTVVDPDNVLGATPDGGPLRVVASLRQALGFE